jgi:hypothetical protein
VIDAVLGALWQDPPQSYCWFELLVPPFVTPPGDAKSDGARVTVTIDKQMIVSNAILPLECISLPPLLPEIGVCPARPTELFASLYSFLYT